MNGLIWGGLAGITAGLFYGRLALGVVMMAAIILNLMIAAAVGVLVPFTLHRMGRDPAQGSSVLLTFITDSMGFFLFLLASRVVLYCCSTLNQRRVQKNVHRPAASKSSASASYRVLPRLVEFALHPGGIRLFPCFVSAACRPNSERRVARVLDEIVTEHALGLRVAPAASSAAPSDSRTG